jgi:hypothetical protein
VQVTEYMAHLNASEAFRNSDDPDNRQSLPYILGNPCLLRFSVPHPAFVSLRRAARRWVPLVWIFRPGKARTPVHRWSTGTKSLLPKGEHENSPGCGAERPEARAIGLPRWGREATTQGSLLRPEPKSISRRENIKITQAGVPTNGSLYVGWRMKSWG